MKDLNATVIEKEEMTFENVRECPQCLERSLYGMRGSVTSICPECGFKDPCCGD